VAIVSHFIFPTPKIIHSPFNYLGWAIVLFALGINIWSVKLLKEENTAIEFHDTPRKLVVTGPFRISRNPIYVGGVVLLFGIAWLLGSMVSFVFPILFFLILNAIYIPDEEERLAAIFGEAYLEYKHRVRRWI
jgi:protein-S-isoprenylcysteine O-methyltransferase Ste14